MSKKQEISLINIINSRGVQDNINAGKKTFLNGNVIFKTQKNENDKSMVFLVKDERYNNFYKVTINTNQNWHNFQATCTCIHNLIPLCRHKIAVLYYLNNKNEGEKSILEDKKYRSLNSLVDLQAFKLITVKNNSSAENFILGQNLLKKSGVNKIEIAPNQLKAELFVKNKKYTVSLVRKIKKEYNSSCSCNSEDNFPLCLHKTIVLLHILEVKGEHFFDEIIDYSIEKESLLKKHGFDFKKDNWKNIYEFELVNDQIYLKSKLKNSLSLVNKIYNEEEQKYHNNTNIDKWHFVVSNNSNLPIVKVAVIEGDYSSERKSFISTFSIVNINDLLGLNLKNDGQKYLVQILKKLSEEEWLKYFEKKFPFEINIQSYKNKDINSLSLNCKINIYEYFYTKLDFLFKHSTHNNKIFYLAEQKKLNSKTVMPIDLSPIPLNLYFELTKSKNIWQLLPLTFLGETKIYLNDYASSAKMFFLQGNELFFWRNLKSIIDLENYFENPIRCKNEELITVYQTKILPISLEYNIIFSTSIKKKSTQQTPKAILHLNERNGTVFFTLRFKYKDLVLDYGHNEHFLNFIDSEVFIFNRNLDYENKIKNYIRSLNENFQEESSSSCILSLKKTLVLKSGWFLFMKEQLDNKNITLIQESTFSNFKLNFSKANLSVQVKSTTNWFDSEVELEINGETFQTHKIKEAIIDNGGLIQMSDGSYNYILTEFLQPLKDLFALAKIENNKLKVHHIHHKIIENLVETVPNTRFAETIKLNDIKNKFTIREVEPAENLKAILRPYQLFGFQWLNYLTEIGFGGILADDMGLGKTIQILTTLKYYQDNHKNLKAIIVCPFTLLFNWEKEIQKFTPSLHYYIYHGQQRFLKPEHFDTYQIVLTSYGTIRSDYAQFANFEVDFIILDESQTIKNPTTKTAKNLLNLNAKHRFCLSGTPLQNNSMDLYSQMNFLNPGLLGSFEEFAKKSGLLIDKYQNEQTITKLKKIINPFILRRTKSLVAQDLPQKINEIIYCKMNEEQRRIYDYYRIIYKEKILGLVEKSGIKKSTFSIIQGLMRLRQICDSTCLLNKPLNLNLKSSSIKIELLLDRLPQHINDHKVLVFSQFIDMLGLIKDGLTKMGIKYNYIDGQTKEIERKNNINQFQQEEEPKIFLISLKTGGLGLNLTAADYVYIVDPWWNPAVEEQAIDRTHRIGQTRKVMSFRMICENTIEEKILNLQQQKLKLVQDLLENEQGFIKNITQEDLEFIFS